MREVGAKMQDRLFSYFTKMYWAGIMGGGWAMFEELSLSGA